MTYSVIVTQAGDWLWTVMVEAKDEEGTVVLSGETSVSCETEQEAYAYGEQVFLPDLRRNFPREIGELVFPWELAGGEEA